MVGFAWWLVIGLVAGLLARFLIPGSQPMGCLTTTALGLLGSVVGGIISSLLTGHDPRAPGFQTSGLLMSTVGAMICLGVYLSYIRRRP